MVKKKNHQLGFQRRVLSGLGERLGISTDKVMQYETLESLDYAILLWMYANNVTLPQTSKIITKLLRKLNISPKYYKKARSCLCRMCSMNLLQPTITGKGRYVIKTYYLTEEGYAFARCIVKACKA